MVKDVAGNTLWVNPWRNNDRGDSNAEMPKGCDVILRDWRYHVIEQSTMFIVHNDQVHFRISGMRVRIIGDEAAVVVE